MFRVFLTIPLQTKMFHFNCAIHFDNHNPSPVFSLYTFSTAFYCLTFFFSIFCFLSAILAKICNQEPSQRLDVTPPNKLLFYIWIQIHSNFKTFIEYCQSLYPNITQMIPTTNQKSFWFTPKPHDPQRLYSHFSFHAGLPHSCQNRILKFAWGFEGFPRKEIQTLTYFSNKVKKVMNHKAKFGLTKVLLLDECFSQNCENIIENKILRHERLILSCGLMGL